MSNKTTALRNARQMYPVIESYLESGLTQKQFYEQNGLSQWTFTYWLRHYRKSKALSDSGAPSSKHTFVPLTAAQPVSCQLSLSDGVRLHIEGLSDAQVLSILTMLMGL